MPEVAGLNLAVDSSKVAQANVELRAMAPAATAAERAAEKWGMTTAAAARTTEDFSKRVQGTIRQLEFERAQLTRTAAEQAKYAALRRAGVSAASAEGQAIAASVAALQAQRAAVQGVAGATGIAGKAATVAAASFRGLAAALGPMVLVFLAIEQAVKAWNTALASGDIGEQAEQIGINTDQLQAYRLVAAQAGIESEALDTAITKLAKSMGDAADGNKDAIARFDQLGVKLLDARGELRPVADVLPEVARGVLEIGSSSQRTATLMELFGRSGAKMATVLEELAKGNDAVIASARQENAIISPAAIAAWDTVGDRMTVTKQIWGALVAELGARFALPLLDDLNKFLATTKTEIDGLIGAWGRLVSAMNAAKAAAPVVTAQNDVQGIQDRLDALRQNPTQFGFKASEKALMDQLAARQAALVAQQSVVQFGQQGAIQAAGMPSASASAFLPQTPLGVTGGGTVGAGSPVAKASGGAGSAAKVIDEAAKAAEKLASWMRDANVAFDAYIANEEVSQQSLFMSKEAAMALRLEQEMLNKAKADDVTLTGEQRQQITGWAEQMAAASEKTRQMTELFDLAKEVTSGFFTDFMQSLREGQSLFEALGNAGMNALNKIADKLMQMAIDDLVGKAFGGSKGGGGGIINFLGGLLGFGGSGGGGTGVGTGTGYTYANGAAFMAGNVIPFARGGIVSRPTLFPMANGAGLMGEAGPEAVMPLRRGPGGRLGVDASGGGGGAVVVNIHNYAEGSKATAKQSKGPGGEMQIDVIVEMVEGKMAGRMARGQGSLGRVIEGTSGVQRVGR